MVTTSPLISEISAFKSSSEASISPRVVLIVATVPLRLVILASRLAMSSSICPKVESTMATVPIRLVMLAWIVSTVVCRVRRPFQSLLVCLLCLLV